MKYWKQKSGKNLAIARTKIKYLGINRTKEAKDLCLENYTTLKKVIKEDTSESTHYIYGLEALTSSKCSYYLKQFIDSVQSLLKYQ